MRSQYARRAFAFFASVVLISCSDSISAPKMSSIAPSAPLRSTVNGAPSVVISQVFGSGSNGTYNKDYIELFNAGTTTANLAGWSLQYAASGATSGNFSANPISQLSGSIPPGHYFLVQMGGSVGSGASYTPDLVPSSAQDLSGASGKIALVNQIGGLACNGSSVACTSDQLGHIIDLVGYGAATFFEGGAAAPGLGSTTAIFRKTGGCTDTDNNGADFATGTPAPRTSATAGITCTAVTIGPIEHVTLTGNAALVVGSSTTLTADAQDAANHSITEATTYDWVSSNENAVKVTAVSGKTATIQGVANGTATITVTATAASGTKTATKDITVSSATIVPSTATVSEIHYDNVGTDAGEAVEIETDANFSLNGWSLVLYDGAKGLVYNTVSLSSLTVASVCGARQVYTTPIAGIQNDVDGWALVNAAGQPVEFKSYEGTFTAVDGPAAGLASTRIDADEGSVPPAGQSVQRAENGVWFGPATSTFGVCNAQTPPPKTGALVVTSGKTSLAFAMQTQFFFSGTDASGNTVTSVNWTTSDPSIIAVDANGIVTGKGVGTAQLIATATNDPTAVAKTNITIYLAASSSGVRLGHNTEFGEPKDADPSDDFLIRRAQYTVSYNPRRGGANWVSWNLDASHIGDNGRCPGTCYSADTALTNAGLTAYTTADWVSNVAGQTGYDRGHMAPSADWTSSEADNNTTFFLSNFLPQRADLNQGPWEVLETYLRSVVADGTHEAYIIAGGIFTNGVGLGTLLDKGKIAIPDSTWKIAVITPAGTGLNADGTLPAGTTVLAVNMPNAIGIRDADWHQWTTTVAKIEKSTGYNFLALIKESVQCKVEGRNCAPSAAITGAGVAGGNEGSTLSFDASTSSDPEGNALTYRWSVDNADAGNAPTLNYTFADNGSFFVRLIVTDDQGAADTTTKAVTIANVTPAVAPISAASLAKGGTYTASGAFTDPGNDTWAATVDYGDGSGAQALTLSGKTFALSHTYAMPGTYSLTVTVRELDPEAAVGTQTTTITVTNNVPSVNTFNGATLFVGEPYIAAGTFTDADPDHWTATVNYGDGTTSALPLLGKNFGLLHPYLAAGTYTVTVSVNDGFQTGTGTASVVVKTALQGFDDLSAMVAQLTGLKDSDMKNLTDRIANAKRKFTDDGKNGPKNSAQELSHLIDDINKDVRDGKISVQTGLSISIYTGRLIIALNN